MTFAIFLTYIILNSVAPSTFVRSAVIFIDIVAIVPWMLLINAVKIFLILNSYMNLLDEYSMKIVKTLFNAICKIDNVLMICKFEFSIIMNQSVISIVWLMRSNKSFVLWMIWRICQQLNVQFFKKLFSKIKHEFLISIRYYFLKYFSICDQKSFQYQIDSLFRCIGCFIRY